MSGRYELLADYRHISLDLLQAFVCYGLSSRRYMYQHIDKIYSRQPAVYRDSYVNSKLFDHPILGIGLSSTRDYFGKVAGIIVHEHGMGKTASVTSLLNRRFKLSVKYYQTHSEIDMEEFAEFLFERSGHLSLSGNDLNMSGMSLYYLWHVHSRCKVLTGFGGFSNLLTDVTNLTIMRINKGINKGTDFLDHIVTEFRAKMQDVSMFEDLWPFTDKRLTLESYLLRMSLIHVFRENLHMRRVSSELNLKSKYYRRPGSLLRIARILTSFNKVAEAFLSGLGMAVDEFTESLEISERDVFDWLTLQQCTSDDNGPDQIRLVCHSLIMFFYSRVLVFSYSSLLAQHSLEQQNLEGLRNKLKSLQDEEGQAATTEVPVSVATDEQGRLERERELLKQVRELQKELEIREEHNKELAALRSYVYREQQVEEHSCPSVEHMVEAIQNKRVVIVGGHPNWLAKVRSRLPKVKILEVSEKHNAPMDSILKADLVVMVYAQIGHTTWDRAMTYAERSSGALHIMPERVNEEETIRELYRAVKEL